MSTTVRCLLVTCVVTLLMNPAQAVSQFTWRRCRNIEREVTELTDKVNRLHRSTGSLEGKAEERLLSRINEILQRNEKDLKRYAEVLSKNRDGM